MNQAQYIEDSHAAHRAVAKAVSDLCQRAGSELGDQAMAEYRWNRYQRGLGVSDDAAIREAEELLERSCEAIHDLAMERLRSLYMDHALDRRS